MVLELAERLDVLLDVEELVPRVVVLLLWVEVPRPEVVVEVLLDERWPLLDDDWVEVPRGAEALRSVRMVFGSAVLPVVRRVFPYRYT